MMNSICRRSAFGGMVVVASLICPGMAQAQPAHFNPGVIVPGEQTLAERINRLETEVGMLKSQLTENEKKLAETTHTANDAKMGLNFALTGINNQLAKLAHHTHEYVDFRRGPNSIHNLEPTPRTSEPIYP